MSLMATGSAPEPFTSATDDVVLKYDWLRKTLSAKSWRVSIQSTPTVGAVVCRLPAPGVVEKFVTPPYTPQYHESANGRVADCATPVAGTSPAAATAASERTTRRDDRMRCTSKGRILRRSHRGPTECHATPFQAPRLRRVPTWGSRRFMRGT